MNASVDSNSTSLLDDEGAPAASDPQERPTDKAAWTTRGLYASDAQAQVLVAALGDAGLTVDVACCGVEILHTTVEATLAKRAELGLPMDAPVFVRASDLRLSATVADRLSRDGLMNVWVVTP